MAESSLKIDDDYCKAVGTFYKTQGEYLNTYIKKYITVLESIKKDAIKQGDVAIALDSYIQYAKKMDNQIKTISTDVQQQVTNFLKDIDNADQYLF